MEVLLINKVNTSISQFLSWEYLKKNLEVVKLLRNVKDSHLITLLTRWHLVHVHSLLHFLFIGSEMTSFFNSILRGREQIVSLLVYLDTKETKRLLKRGTVYG